MPAFWDPREYIDRDARYATADTPPPLEQRIGFVTQSPGDLYLVAKGLTSSTKALVTTLRSSTEIVTSRNEHIRVRNDRESFTAVDTGASTTNEADRNLLMIPEEPVAEEIVPADNPPVEDEVSIVNEAPDVVDESQSTIETATPSEPKQYVKPESDGTVSVVGQKMSTGAAKFLGLL